MDKSNLCIVGLSKQFTDNLCKKLANKMDMYYANIEEIFAYDLMDMGRIEEVCGIDYLLREEKSIIKRVCSYENTLINIDYILLNNDDILNIVRGNCVVIYVALTEDNFLIQQNNEMLSSNVISISKDVFCERDCLLRKVSDIVVDCYNLEINHVMESVINKVLEYYA